MPDQQSGHQSDDGSKDHHADDGPNDPRALLLLQLFVVRCGQELDIGVPVLVLDDRQSVVFVNSGNTWVDI